MIIKTKRHNKEPKIQLFWGKYKKLKKSEKNS